MKPVKNHLSLGQRKVLALLLPLGIIFAAYIFIDVFYTVPYERTVFTDPPTIITDYLHPHWNSWNHTWWIWGLALVAITGVELYLFKSEE